jgi:hypothetical protein
MTRNPLLLLGALALACLGPSVPIAAAAPPLGPPDPLPSQAQLLQTQQGPDAVFSGTGRHLVCDGELEPAGRDHDHHQLHGQRSHPVDDPE